MPDFANFFFISAKQVSSGIFMRHKWPIEDIMSHVLLRTHCNKNPFIIDIVSSLIKSYVIWVQ